MSVEVGGYNQEICGSGSPTASQGSSKVRPEVALNFAVDVTTRTGTKKIICIFRCVYNYITNRSCTGASNRMSEL